jgi:hypothetical protein
MTGYNSFGLLVLEVDEEDNGVLGRNWIRWQCMVVNQWPRVFGLGLEWLEISVWFWCGWLEAVAWFLFLWVWEALSLVASWVLGRFCFVLSFWNQRLVLPLPLSCGIPCFLWREKAEVLNDLEAWFIEIGLEIIWVVIKGFWSWNLDWMSSIWEAKIEGLWFWI